MTRPRYLQISWNCHPNSLSENLYELRDSDDRNLTTNKNERYEVAKIIAAAPDLLRELKNLVRIEEQEAANAGKEFTPWLERARAAIAKAEGGA